MRRILAVLLSLFFALVGCSVNPVTGKNVFILPNLDESWEREVGQEMYAPMRQSQGGDYILDPALSDYVTTVGNRLAAQASRDLAYEFRVLNDSVPNAWALPGGKIVVNRGLLTELGSEAELAAVLGHEIVHADAAHGARQQSKGLLTQVGMMAVILYGSSKAETELGQQIAVIVPQLGAQLISSKYGRDAERESDLYGMNYMSAAGYNPQGAVELQETFVKLSENNRSDWLSGLFASHPASKERVDNNRATAANLPEGGEFGRDVFIRKTAHLRRLKPAYEAHDKAREELEQNNIRQARVLATRAIELEPREALFFALSGDIDAASKDFRRAERAFDSALQRDDSFFYHYLRRGQIRHELGNYAAARSDLERSIELLPTSEANLVLGNLEKRAGNMDSASRYYQAAANPNTPTGKQAQKELVLIELPRNPGKYIQTGAVLAQNGNVAAVALNNAPITLNNIRLKVEYYDANGRLQQFSRYVRGSLGPGEQTAVPTNIRDILDSDELANRVQVTVLSAQVANP